MVLASGYDGGSLGFVVLVCSYVSQVDVKSRDPFKENYINDNYIIVHWQPTSCCMSPTWSEFKYHIKTSNNKYKFSKFLWVLLKHKHHERENKRTWD
jgi:hypothetical protein